jgi:CheY-like chemotaxis protein
VKRGVELNELVSGVERTLRRVLDREIMLTAALACEPLRVLGDAAQLEQVVVNLVLDARDAIAQCGHIEIATRRWRESSDDWRELEGLTGADYACIEVCDHGGGRSKETQGLGLETSFEIVRRHAGLIRIQSEPGKGTQMRVFLPLAMSPEVAPKTSGVLPVVRKSKRVLVVEDEPQIRALAARALTSAGFEVQQAANGALGLSMLQAQCPAFDVIVTDVVMPELTGPEMARKARELQPSVGLVFMSGFPDAMLSAHANEFQGAAFLAKPFSAQVLIEAVRECAATDGELRELGS